MQPRIRNTVARPAWNWSCGKIEALPALPAGAVIVRWGAHGSIAILDGESYILSQETLVRMSDYLLQAWILVLLANATFIHLMKWSGEFGFLWLAFPGPWKCPGAGGWRGRSTVGVAIGTTLTKEVAQPTNITAIFTVKGPRNLTRHRPVRNLLQ